MGWASQSDQFCVLAPCRSHILANIWPTVQLIGTISAGATLYAYLYNRCEHQLRKNSTAQGPARICPSTGQAGVTLLSPSCLSPITLLCLQPDPAVLLPRHTRSRSVCVCHQHLRRSVPAPGLPHQCQLRPVGRSA